MVLFALSFQGQVEKYGVYVGIAAFFGLAVLSLLYFSQARELKRLREWAGRAPERARELEQRVVAQATATVARKPPSMPGAPATGGIAPPRRLAEMPAPVAGAQTAAGAQATELAEAVEGEEAAEPATNGNVPGPPAAVPGPAGAANGSAPPAEGVEGEAEELPAADGDGEAEPEEEGEAAADATEAEAGVDSEGADATAAEAGAVTAGSAGADATAAELGAVTAGSAAAAAAGTRAEGTDDEAAASAAPGGADRAPGDAAPGDRAPAGADRAPGDAALGDAADESAEHEPAPRPGEVPAAVPRATPAQRVGVTPRPAPLPLRQTRPSASPASARGGGPRRPGGAPPRRAAKPPREGRSAGTIALFIGIAVLLLGGGTFAVSQLTGDDSPPAPNRATPPPTKTATSDNSAPQSGKTAAETNVAVLNGTTFTGLAGQLADRIAQEGGFQRGATETNTRDQTIQASTVFYAPGFRAQARSVAELLSISGVEPLDEDTQALAPEADVVVLAGADQAP